MMELRSLLVLLLFVSGAAASDYDDYDDRIDAGLGEVTSLLQPQLPPDDDLGFIVTFKQPQLPGTTQQVLTQVHQALEEDGTANATTTNLTAMSSIETQPSGGSASSGGTDDRNVHGFVVDLGSIDQSSAVKALQNNSLVSSVFRDRWVTVADAGPGNAAAPAAAASSAAADDTAAAPAAAGAAAAGQVTACVSPWELSSGLTGSLAPNQWNSACVNRRNRLVWVGQRCGTNLTQIHYIAIIALNKASNQPAMNGKKPCVLRFDPKQFARWNLQRFGTCGRAPDSNPSLPSCVGRGSCVKTALGAPIPLTGSVPATANMTVSGVKCGGQAVSSLTYEGRSCGPNNTHVIWRAAVAPGGCRITNKLFEQLQSTPLEAPSSFLAGVQPAELQATLEVFGLGCGSPPRAAAKTLALSRLCRGKEPPPSGNHKLARKPLQPGQQVPPGISRIGSFLAGQGIPDLSLKSDTPVTVAVFDTGIWPHPDLNVVGGKSFVTSGDENDTSATFDGHGHGTHVAGIVGAKGGVVGVSPGVQLFSVKVMKSTGFGRLQDLISALDWLRVHGRDNDILVAVMSLAVQVTEGTFGYEQGPKKSVCSLVTDVTKQGIVVVVAAGNNNFDYQGKLLPADCPDAVVVTALNATNNGPASFSNRISENAQPEDRENVFAAPGFARSTVPPQIKNSTYALLQGTSQAAPHVAGVFANCFLSGACQGTNYAQSAMQTVKADSVRRLNDQSRWQPYGFAGDGNSTINGLWRGFLVWNAY